MDTRVGRESFCLSVRPGVRDAVVDAWTLACPAGHPSAHGSWTAAERWVRSREWGWGLLKVPAPFTGCRVPSQRGAGGVSSSCLLTGRRGASDTSRIAGGGLGACQPLPTLPHLSPQGFLSGRGQFGEGLSQGKETMSPNAPEQLVEQHMPPARRPQVKFRAGALGRWHPWGLQP